LSLPHRVLFASKTFEEERGYYGAKMVGTEVAGEGLFGPPALTAGAGDYGDDDDAWVWSDAANRNVPRGSDNAVQVVVMWGEALERAVFPGLAAAAAEAPVEPLTPEGGLELFSVTEKLSALESWRCPRCKDHKEATKKMDLWTLPPLLCLHFKRFSADGFGIDKLETPVAFPMHFDSSNFCHNPAPNPGYTLAAVSNHWGGTGGGHYTAHARCANGQWYEFDDSRVTAASPAALDKAAAYVLFYVRDDHKPAAWATPPAPPAESSSTDGEDSD
jgi:hypothetical protein